MILYLCSNQNTNLFDFLDKDRGLPIKKMVGSFKLRQFVIHDVRNLSQFGFFIIDLKALKDTETEIVEAIEAFGVMYSARVILFAEGMELGSQLLSRIIDQGVYNIITASDIDEIRKDMLECVSPAGKDVRTTLKGKYFAIDRDNDKSRNEYLFLCKNIKIAVVGATRRVGTTTTAFNLVNFLRDVGADAAYVEANQHNHLRSLPEFYPDMRVKLTNGATVNNTQTEEGDSKTTGDFIEYLGTEYYFHGNFPEGKNFTVVDFGEIQQCRVQALKQCERVILCGMAKPYEMSALKDALAESEGIPLNIVIAGVPLKDQSGVAGMFEGRDRRVLFSEYSPDLFDGKANAERFLDIVREYAKEKPRIEI